MYNIFMDFNIIYIFFHYKMWRKIPWKIITCPFISWITSVFEKYIINYYARLLCNFIILNLVQDLSIDIYHFNYNLQNTEAIFASHRVKHVIIATRNNLICLQLQNNVNFLVQHERRISRLGQIKDVTFVVGA